MSKRFLGISPWYSSGFGTDPKRFYNLGLSIRVKPYLAGRTRWNNISLNPRIKLFKYSFRFSFTLQYPVGRRNV